MDGTRITANEASAIDTTSCAVAITRAQLDSNNQTGTLTAAIRVSGGSIALVRSVVRNNRGGGLDIGNNATFSLVGNIVVANGATTSNVGGISISTTASVNRLEFNSIAENTAQGGAVAGVACAANVGFAAANNIIWNSRTNGVAGLQIFGGCGYAYSDIGPNAISAGIPTSNLQNVDPVFVGETTDRSAPVRQQPAEPPAGRSSGEPCRHRIARH